MSTTTSQSDQHSEPVERFDGVSRAAWINDAINAAALLSADIVATVFASEIAFHIAKRLSETLTGAPFVFFSKAIDERAPVALPILLVCLVWMYGRGHYFERVPFWTEAREIVSVAALGFIAEGFIEYAVKEHVSRLWTMLAWLLFIPLCVLIRSWMKWALGKIGARQIKVFLFDDRDGVTRAALESEKMLGFEIIGSATQATTDEAPIMVRRSGARLAIVAVNGDADIAGSAIAHALAHEDIPFALCPPLGALGFASMRPMALFGHNAVLLVERRGLYDPLARGVKRASDILGALAGLAVLGPLALPFVIATKFSGPAFFAQNRIGRNGRLISVFKIRSMVVDADARLAKLIESNPAAQAEWATSHKLKDDPRITRLGKFLRVSAIDEIPQLWNVLVGDMSLVGPRPIVEAELQKYGKTASTYLKIRPGLTGLWQVSGRSDTTYDRRVELDSWYARNWSLWVDAVVIMKTLPALMSGRGAY